MTAAEASLLVLDSSVLVASVLPDETGSDLAHLAEQYADLTAPALLWVEVRNVFLSAERRGRIAPEDVDAALEHIEAASISLDQAPRSAALLRLARRHQLSAYDTLYLELALRTSANLATLDARLAAAAEAEGVRVVS